MCVCARTQLRLLFVANKHRHTHPNQPFKSPILHYTKTRTVTCPFPVVLEGLHLSAHLTNLILTAPPGAKMT